MTIPTPRVAPIPAPRGATLEDMVTLTRAINIQLENLQAAIDIIKTAVGI